MLIFLIHIISFVVLTAIVVHYFYCIFVSLRADAMQSEDAKYLKRKVKSGSIDVHPTEKALVVNYELEAFILAQNGNPMHGNKKNHQKVIRLSSLNSRTDCSKLAKEVVDKCNLIHPSKLAEVEQLIYYIKKRSEGSHRVNSTLSSINSSRSNSRNSITMSPIDNTKHIATLNCIDDYIELLYEDIPEKIKGSALILQLARNPDNLIELAKNEALLSALSRVLREEWKRSIELSTNIVYTFFCFSTYSDFHSIIIQYKIGSLCMDVIDYEMKRYDQWKEKVEGKKKPPSPDKELPKSRIPEPKRRPKSGTWAVAEANGMKTRGICSSYHEDLCNASDESLVKTDEEQMRRKLKTLAKRQEQLLRVSFYLLLNIADNTRVEEKMHKRDIVGLLIGAMERHNNVDLLILILSFLQKLSIYIENKTSMACKGIIEKIAGFLDSANPDLVNVTLKLLFNLSFDTKLRNKMVKIGLLPKLIKFTSDDKQVNIVMKLLYHLSLDDRVKVLFAQTDSVKLLTDMLLMNLSGISSAWSSELMALLVNLAMSRRAAVLIAGEGRLSELIAGAFRNAHPIIMKIVRNLSYHAEIQPMFIEYVGDIAGAATNGDAPEDFAIECLGTLSNILTPDIDVRAVAERYNLINYIMKVLQPESDAPDDLILEAIILCGALCSDEWSAMSICSAKGATELIRVLREKQADDEVVLQSVYVFRHMLQHTATAKYLVKQTDAPAYLIDLMQDKNPEIRKLCDSCLDIISQMESNWATRIKVERFRCHNGQWLSVVETLESGDEPEELPPYLSANYLTDHTLLPSESQTSLTNESDSLSVENDTIDNRPLSKYIRDTEEMEFSMMANSGLLNHSTDNDSIMATELNLVA